MSISSRFWYWWRPQQAQQQPPIPRWEACLVGPQVHGKRIPHNTREEAEDAAREMLTDAPSGWRAYVAEIHDNDDATLHQITLPD